MNASYAVFSFLHPLALPIYRPSPRLQGLLPPDGGTVSHGSRRSVPASPILQSQTLTLRDAGPADSCAACPHSLCAARTAECYSGSASITHSRRIPFFAVPRSRAAAQRTRPCPRQPSPSAGSRVPLRPTPPGHPASRFYFSAVHITSGRDAPHPCPAPPLATRTAECHSGSASMAHSRRIPFYALPHSQGSGAEGAPLPRQVGNAIITAPFPSSGTQHPSRFPPIPVPALSVCQAAFAAYPHTPPLRSGVFRYSTVHLTNLVRRDHPAAPNGSIKKINTLPFGLPSYHASPACTHFKSVGSRPHTAGRRKYWGSRLPAQFWCCLSGVPPPSSWHFSAILSPSPPLFPPLYFRCHSVILLSLFSGLAQIILLRKRF